MAETAKAKSRRLEDGFFRYCIGDGIDIGCGNDPLLKSIDKWDISLGSGDATFMHGVEDEEYDFVYSAHCLEHISDPIIALNNWFRILKNNGFLILYLPHRDLYEKRKLLPSKWNYDHKFFILPEKNDPPHTWGLKYLIKQTNYNFEIEYIKTCDLNFTINDPNLHSNGEYSIETIIRKISMK